MTTVAQTSLGHLYYVLGRLGMKEIVEAMTAFIEKVGWPGVVVVLSLFVMKEVVPDFQDALHRLEDRMNAVEDSRRSLEIQIEKLSARLAPMEEKLREHRADHDRLSDGQRELERDVMEGMYGKPNKRNR